MHIDKLCLSDFICAEISDYHPNGHFESNDKILIKFPIRDFLCKQIF